MSETEKNKDEKQNKITNKEKIKAIHRSVVNSKNENQYPDINDYTRAVLEYENPDIFNGKDNTTISKCIGKSRRGVSLALEKLVKEGDFVKKGKYYASKERVKSFAARDALLNSLHPDTENVIRVSKKLFVIPLKKDDSISEFSATDSEQTELNYSIRVSEDKGSANLNLVDSDIRSEVIELQVQMSALANEIAELKKKVDKLSARHVNNRVINTIKQDLADFIEYPELTVIVNVKTNIIILIDSNDKDFCTKIYNKLNNLIIEINKRSKISLTKKRKKSKYKEQEA